MEFQALSRKKVFDYRVCAHNLLNQTVYSFGAEFINFNALRPAASAEQRRAFLDSFLVPTHTLRPRSLRVGLRFDF